MLNTKAGDQPPAYQLKEYAMKTKLKPSFKNKQSKSADHICNRINQK